LVPLSLPAALDDEAIEFRTTRKHKSDVSPTSARHSLVQSSMIVRMRKWRPLMGWSEMKWRLQRSLGAKGIIIGALVRLRVCRSRRARTASFPHRTAGRALCDPPASPSASKGYECADSRSVGVHDQSPSSAPESRSSGTRGIPIKPSCGRRSIQSRTGFHW
jgi:hypothetical protein